MRYLVQHVYPVEGNTHERRRRLIGKYTQVMDALRSAYDEAAQLGYGVIEVRREGDISTIATFQFRWDQTCLDPGLKDLADRAEHLLDGAKYSQEYYGRPMAERYGIKPPLDPNPVVTRPTMYMCYKWWDSIWGTMNYPKSMYEQHPTDEWVMAEYERVHGLPAQPLVDPRRRTELNDML